MDTTRKASNALMTVTDFYATALAEVERERQLLLVENTTLRERLAARDAEVAELLNDRAAEAHR